MTKNTIEIEIPPDGTADAVWGEWMINTLGRLMAHLPPSALQLVSAGLAAANAQNPSVAPFGTAMLMQGMAAEVGNLNPPAPPAPPSWVDDIVKANEKIPCLCAAGEDWCPRHPRK